MDIAHQATDQDIERALLILITITTIEVHQKNTWDRVTNLHIRLLQLILTMLPQQEDLSDMLQIMVISNIQIQTKIDEWSNDPQIMTNYYLITNLQIMIMISKSLVPVTLYTQVMKTLGCTFTRRRPHDQHCCSVLVLWREWLSLL